MYWFVNTRCITLLFPALMQWLMVDKLKPKICGIGYRSIVFRHRFSYKWMISIMKYLIYSLTLFGRLVWLPSFPTPQYSSTCPACCDINPTYHAAHMTSWLNTHDCIITKYYWMLLMVDKKSDLLLDFRGIARKQALQLTKSASTSDQPVHWLNPTR